MKKQCNHSWDKEAKVKFSMGSSLLDAKVIRMLDKPVCQECGKVKYHNVFLRRIYEKAR